MKTATTRPEITFFNREGDGVTVPDWVIDINAFRCWLDEDEVPEKLRAHWVKGKVFIDMSGEQIFTHVLVKTELAIVLGTLVKKERRGVYLTDGVLLSNFAADISVKPDGMFLTYETRKSARVRLIEGKKSGHTELQGSPDMVLEVLSESSENKDEILLKQGYWEADIPEYWLVDARGDKPRLDIYRRSAKGYVAGRKQDGWVKSNLFEKSFRLLVRPGPAGDPEYTLEVK